MPVTPSSRLYYPRKPVILVLALVLMPLSMMAQGPRIACEKPEFNFGPVLRGTVVSNTFLVSNTGDSPLEITKIYSCCGARTQLGTSSIAPGSNTTLAASLKVTGSYGKVRKTLFVRSNDPKTRVFKLNFVGEILREGQGGRPAVSNVVNAPVVPEKKPVATNTNALVTVDFFFEHGCSECEKISGDILPELDRRYHGKYLLNMRDIAIESNVLYLFALEDALGVTNGKTLTVIYLNGKYGYYGYRQMLEQGLVEEVGAILEGKDQDDGPAPSVPPVVVDGIAPVEDRADRFTLPAVAFGGLVDGLNPCAISTLVFFMSLLAVSKVEGRGILIMGLCFTAASFITYLALGFGLLHAIHAFSGFPLVRTWIEVVMIVVLVVLAFLSFRDAHLYKANQDPKSVLLQLPDSVKRLTHKIMRRGLGTGSLALGGFMVGAAVTGLESVCTGQVYLPTLVLIIKHGRITPAIEASK